MNLKRIIVVLTIIILFVVFLQPHINDTTNEDKDGEITTKYDLIKEMIKKTNSTRIRNNIEYLQSQDTRYIGTDGNHNATIWIKDKFESFGLNTLYQNFSYNGLKMSNIIAYHEGSDKDKKSETTILCAHFDSINGEDVNLSAPGADDDASGVAAIIESARILSNYEYNKTIMFCAWNAEEVGLVGSDYFVDNIDNFEYDIQGVLNFDMIGYSKDGNDITIHSNQNSIDLKDEVMHVKNTLDLSLNITSITEKPEKRSDHFSFWKSSYKACLFIEKRFNPYYHTSNDTLDKISVSMIESVTKLTIGSSAKLSEINSSLNMIKSNELCHKNLIIYSLELVCTDSKTLTDKKYDDVFKW